MAISTDGSFDRQEVWEFELYINGDTYDNRRVESKLRSLCEHHLKDKFSIHVIDIAEEDVDLPDSLLAVPTIIRLSPLPERRVIGNLSSYKRAVEGLGLHQIGDWDRSYERHD